MLYNFLFFVFGFGAAVLLDYILTMIEGDCHYCGGETFLWGGGKEYCRECGKRQ